MIFLNPLYFSFFITTVILQKTFLFLSLAIIYDDYLLIRMPKSFTLSAFKNIKQTGSLFRSSKFLAKKLTESLSSDQPLTVVELGAGDGVITKEILDKISPKSRLYTYEINNNFIPHLSAFKDDRLTIFNQSVEKLRSDFGYNDVDIIISSLPLANINKTFKEQLIRNVKFVLKDKGQFIQYQYSKNDKKILETNFKELSTQFCFFNMPPAIIYNCVNFV